jgi:hypothetical protein
MAKRSTTYMPQVIATDLPQEDLELVKMYMRGAQILHKNNTKRHSGVDIFIRL